MNSPDSREVAARALVIFPGALGDLVCAVPAIRAIARRHPGTRLELMARADLARFAVGRIAQVARDHSIDSREMSAMFRAGGGADESARAFFGTFGAIHSFFAAGDACFRGSLREAASGAPVSFYPFRPEGGGHVAQEYLRAVGAASEPADPSIELSQSDLDGAIQVLARSGLERARFVMILPGSGSPSKNWPPERFAGLAAALAPPMRPLVVLGPAEEKIAQVFLGAKLAVVRDLPLETVAALATMSAAFVGNDSGVTHLAAAAGARGVAIFGPTEPPRWRPFGAVSVLRRSPISALPVGEVLSELRQVLG
jgi:heptosyltransferase-3